MCGEEALVPAASVAWVAAGPHMCETHPVRGVKLGPCTKGCVCSPWVYTRVSFALQACLSTGQILTGHPLAFAALIIYYYGQI